MCFSFLGFIALRGEKIIIESEQTDRRTDNLYQVDWTVEVSWYFEFGVNNARVIMFIRSQQPTSAEHWRLMWVGDIQIKLSKKQFVIRFCYNIISIISKQGNQKSGSTLLVVDVNICVLTAVGIVDLLCNSGSIYVEKKTKCPQRHPLQRGKFTT